MTMYWKGFLIVFAVSLFAVWIAHLTPEEMAHINAIVGSW